VNPILLWEPDIFLFLVEQQKDGEDGAQDNLCWLWSPSLVAWLREGEGWIDGGREGEGERALFFFLSSFGALYVR
jgi:hypothetical protein